MNPVEIEEAVSELAQQPFDAGEFPFQFLAAFGNKATTVTRLRAGNTNQSDIPGGVLQRSHIHLATCAPGNVDATLTALRSSPKTASQKARFILATDGLDFQAEDVTTGETVACDYADFADHFGFFLPLAGITTVAQIRESSFDIRATGRLNKLYIELLRHNPDWAKAERRADMNHFMARLIFCFFAEDTDIFHPSYRFTATVEKMSAGAGDNTHEVIQELFRAMNTPIADRKSAGIKSWADPFPYVNGALFSGNIDVPRFSKIARSYLIHIGNLDWTRINPDIFGSMIQAVADDEERGALGMHYTSVPNILKVLNPLFLDDLRAKLEEAGDNARKLLNLRSRMAKIRVFDPACGSGNFLVIAYKEMRAIEAEINKRRGEYDRKTEIPLTNFRGIELRDFPAEIARLALIIAEYQCDVLYRGQKEALAEFLPLDSQNWITCGNALRLDWLSICEPQGKGGGRIFADDLYGAPLDQAKIGFANEGGETYICGNPPYKGSQDQTSEQKSDLADLFDGTSISSGSADYVFGWFLKASRYVRSIDGTFAFVTTNSIHQGRQVSRFWPEILGSDLEIAFGEPSFKWTNLASKKAAVIVSVIGVAKLGAREKALYIDGLVKSCSQIGPYLVPDQVVVVEEERSPLSPAPTMVFGSMANDGGGLILNYSEASEIVGRNYESRHYVRPFIGTSELTKGTLRYCLWMPGDEEPQHGSSIIAQRVERVRQTRSKSTRATTNKLQRYPHRFGEVRQSGCPPSAPMAQI
ncbi:MAG: DNA methyltransferase [Pseudomonadota bacterium]